MKAIIVTMLFLSTLQTWAQTPSGTQPAWLERIQVGGDFRFRHEYISKTKPTDTSESHKERMRLRLTVQSQLNSQIKAKARLATGDSQSPISGNTTFTDNANKKGVYVDQAMVEWKPYEQGSLYLGKIENPLRVLPQSQLIYDADYNPEGAAYSGKFSFPMFVTLAGYVIQERSQQADGTSEPDSWLLAGMVGTKVDSSETGWGYTVAAGYHNFTALKKNAALAPTSTTATYPFSGNSFYGTGASGRYLHDYQVAELLGELRWRQSGQLISIYFDALNNFYLEEDNRALGIGAQFQTLNDEKKAIWTFGYAYLTIDKDATVSALNDSDYANGLDGVHGHQLNVGRSLSDNTSAMLTLYRANIDGGGTPFKSDRAMLDLVFVY